MQIQVERLWLFETSVSEPFFFGEKDGITVQMLDDRTIDFLDIVTVYFFVDEFAKSGINYTFNYGGEDSSPKGSFGKSSFDYSIEFNLPTFNLDVLEKMVGKEFSILGMRRDLSHFVIFGRFIIESLSIDNEVQQRARFRASNTNAKIYNVNNFNITQIVEPVETPSNLGGFEYEFDFYFD